MAFHKNLLEQNFTLHFLEDCRHQTVVRGRIGVSVMSWFGQDWKSPRLMDGLSLPCSGEKKGNSQSTSGQIAKYSPTSTWNFLKIPGNFHYFHLPIIGFNERTWGVWHLLALSWHRATGSEPSNWSLGGGRKRRSKKTTCKKYWFNHFIS